MIPVKQGASKTHLKQHSNSFGVEESQVILSQFLKKRGKLQVLQVLSDSGCPLLATETSPWIRLLQGQQLRLRRGTPSQPGAWL